jgi:hypothetical protein
MADTKITALAAITTVDPAADVLPIVDISDTSMAASGTTKKITSNQILGAGGTATLASATITGDLTVDTSTLKVDSTNNRVGIGTASPTAALDVNLAEVSSAAGTSAIITNTTGGGNRIAALRLNNLSNNWHIRAVGAVTDDLRIGAGVIGSEVDYLAIGNTGNVNVALGNVVMATSGKGIDFSATAGTGTSELLADYEEGTFTPTIVGSTTAGTGTYSNQSGIYTKVGRQVTVQIYLTWSAHTGTGNIFVGNLPFTNASNYWSASVGYLNNIALTAGSVMTAFVEISASYITLWQYPTGGGAATEVPIDATGGIMLSASYNV